MIVTSFTQACNQNSQHESCCAKGTPLAPPSPRKNGAHLRRNQLQQNRSVRILRCCVQRRGARCHSPLVYVAFGLQTCGAEIRSLRPIHATHEKRSIHVGNLNEQFGHFIVATIACIVQRCNGRIRLISVDVGMGVDENLPQHKQITFLPLRGHHILRQRTLTAFRNPALAAFQSEEQPPFVV